MYAVAKAPNGVFSKTRLHGFNGVGKYNGNSNLIIEPKASISPPSGSRSPDDVTCRSSSVDSITSTGPRPVFLGCAKQDATMAGRGIRNGKKTQQQKTKQQSPQAQLEQSDAQTRTDYEVVSFFARSWLAVNQALETAPSSTPSRPTVVHYRPAEPTKLPDFVPCNYERVWVDHQYHKLMRHIDLTIQTRNQNVQESKSC